MRSLAHFLPTLALLITALVAPVRADIPPPRPTQIVVKNLNAFPDFTFSYIVNSDPKSAKKLTDGKAIESLEDIALRVQSGNQPPQVWATFPRDWKGKSVTLAVDKVERSGATIRVKYRELAPGKSSAGLSAQPLLLFALAAGGACGLVVLARRRHPAA